MSDCQDGVISLKFRKQPILEAPAFVVQRKYFEEWNVNSDIVEIQVTWPKYLIDFLVGVGISAS